MRGDEHACCGRSDADLHEHRAVDLAVIDAIELALLEGSEVPHARPDLLDRFRDRSCAAYVRHGVVEARAGEARQVLGVGGAAHEDADLRAGIGFGRELL